jgi:tRNA(Ile)-lysidine synthase
VSLLTGWADRHGLAHVMLGHTADDQAETFLMRLARGSGVDGLAGMSADDDFLFLRPLLGVRRAALREVLTAKGVAWIEDPTNDDTRYDRIKARQMLPLLEDLGLTVDRVLATMGHMTRARISLGHAAAAFADRHVRAEAGDLVFAPEALAMIGGDSPGRVLAGAIRWIGGRDHRPRYAALVDMAAALRAGEARTLNGVRMLPEAGGVRFSRELAAAREVVDAPEGASLVLWDGRWGLRPPERGGVLRKATPGAFPPGLTIRALGEDIAQVKGWRDVGLPRASLMASPGVFRGAELVAAPVAGLQNGWTARIVADFRTFLLSH